MAGKRDGLQRTIPKWLKGFLDFEGAQRIEQAVGQAESRTEAEIVPMIVKSSTATSSVTPRLLLYTVLFTFALAPQIEPWVPGPYAAFTPVLLIFFGLFLTIMIAPLSAVQRVVLPKKDQITDVEHRAVYEYHQKKIGRTRNETGVLIFVSLMEHRAIILAEGEILERVEKELWLNAIDRLLAQIKDGKVTEGFIEAIEMCTQRLSEVAPAKPDNPNQISNHLIIEE